MGHAISPHTGRCFCGAVQFTLDGPPQDAQEFPQLAPADGGWLPKLRDLPKEMGGSGERMPE